MSDTMLIGVLRMPVDDRGDLTLMQFISRAREAADRIERDAAEIESLRNVIDVAHGFIRHGLRVANDAPLRFDYYAQEIERLQTQHAAMATFINEAIDAAFDGAGLDGAWIQERAAALGLLNAEAYCPQNHPDADRTLFAPGDTIYVRAPWLGTRDADG